MTTTDTTPTPMQRLLGDVAIRYVGSALRPCDRWRPAPGTTDAIQVAQPLTSPPWWTWSDPVSTPTQVVDAALAGPQG